MPVGRGQRHLDPAVAVVGRVDLPDPRVGPAHLAARARAPAPPWRRWASGQRRRPTGPARRPPRRRARPGPRRGRGWRSWRCPGPRPASRRPPSSSEPAQAKPSRLPPPAPASEDPDAHARRGGRRQRLDLAVVGPDLGVVAPGDVHLELLARVGPADDRRSASSQQVAHVTPVPPMVTPVMRRVGCPQPTGHALPVLAAGPRRHGEVVGHGVDAAQHLGTVADQVGVAQRLGDPPVLDQVGLGRAEHEVPGGRVDLAAAELGHVDARGGLGHDLVGVLVAGQQEGVGHPHHGQVLVALAPAVARRRAGPPCGPAASPTCSR